ncbi:extracellular solute-binding protein [Paracoccaceae bacterium]|nr:extracellular solute-binding protein [Paracoccaceae bacterium]
MNFILSTIILFLALSLTKVIGAEVNIYSHRQPFLINPFLEKFTEETGIKTNVVYATKGLAQRLKAEGKNSPADVILTVDIGRLYIYDDLDLLASIDSDILNKNIPQNLKSPENKWFALSKRSRIIVTSKERVAEGQITKIEDLANEKWKGKICTRPGSHVYNRALMASLILSLGEKTAEEWAKKFVDNLSRRPQGNDRAQVKAIFEGQCDISIINNYYFGKLKYSEDPNQREWAKSVRLIFPNQGVEERGAHINISGGGVARYSKNRTEALALLEFLSKAQSQKMYGEINFEYPVNPSVETTEELKSWGSFKSDRLPIISIAQKAYEAQKIIDRVGW